jgi:hypothetical protein
MSKIVTNVRSIALKKYIYNFFFFFLRFDYKYYNVLEMKVVRCTCCPLRYAICRESTTGSIRFRELEHQYPNIGYHYLPAFQSVRFGGCLG